MGVTTIGEGAFNGCTALCSANVSWTEGTELNFATDIFDSETSGALRVPLGTYDFYNSAKQTWLPEAWTIVEIGKIDDDYKDGQGLKFDITSGSAKVVGYEGGLTNVEIPGVVIKGDNSYPVTAINSKVFNNNKKLTDLIIPEGVESIGESAFNSCVALRTVTMPSTLTYLGKKAFYNCRELDEIEIPGGVDTIYSETFRYCYDLMTVTIHEGVTTIGSSAFYKCQNLWTITLPSTITSIGYEAFFDTSIAIATLGTGFVTAINAEGDGDWVSEVKLLTGVLNYQASVPEGVSAYYLRSKRTEDGDDYARFAPFTKDIPANQPFIGSIDPASFKGKVFYEKFGYMGNLYHMTDVFPESTGEVQKVPSSVKVGSQTLALVGNATEPLTLTDETTNYVLVMRQVGYWRHVEPIFARYSGKTLPAGKAALTVKGGDASVRSLTVVFDDIDDSLTGVDNPTTPTTAEGAIFRLTGQRASRMEEGKIYIVNGKKVMK